MSKIDYKYRSNKSSVAPLEYMKAGALYWICLIWGTRRDGSSLDIEKISRERQMSLEYEMGIEFVWLGKRLAGMEYIYWNWLIVENVKRYMLSFKCESKIKFVWSRNDDWIFLMEWRSGGILKGGTLHWIFLIGERGGVLILELADWRESGCLPPASLPATGVL